jgi:hypothetical protein
LPIPIIQRNLLGQNNNFERKNSQIIILKNQPGTHPEKYLSRRHRESGGARRNVLKTRRLSGYYLQIAKMSHDFSTSLSDYLLRESPLSPLLHGKMT